MTQSNGNTFTLPVNYNELHWTEIKVVRELYVRQQQERCCFCGELLTNKSRSDIASKPIRRSAFPPNFFKYGVHLHHNHKTGMTIGAVHSYCNAVLWQYHGE